MSGHDFGVVSRDVPPQRKPGESRRCELCGLDLEPRLVAREVTRPSGLTARVVNTKVRAMPRHARVRLAWEGSIGAAPETEPKALSICICAACVGARRIGEVLAVLADQFLEVAK